MEDQDTLIQQIDTLTKDSLGLVSVFDSLTYADSVLIKKPEVITEQVTVNNPPPSKELKTTNFKAINEIEVFKQNKLPFWTKSLPEETRISYQGKKVFNQEFSFLLAPILLIGVFLAIVKPLRNKKIFQFFNASISNRFFNQLAREEDTALNPINLLLFSIYAISTSLIVFNGFVFLSEGVPFSISLVLYLGVLFGSILIFSFKSIFIYFTIGLFNSREAIGIYHFQLLLFTKVLGLLLIVPAILSSFGYAQIREIFLYLGIGVYALMFCIRIAKSFLSATRLRMADWQYIILYICSLEIVPLAIILKSLSV